MELIRNTGGREGHIIGIENRLSMSMAGDFKLLGNIVTI